jgi:hypothetical protein
MRSLSEIADAPGVSGPRPAARVAVFLAFAMAPPWRGLGSARCYSTESSHFNMLQICNQNCCDLATRWKIHCCRIAHDLLRSCSMLKNIMLQDRSIVARLSFLSFWVYSGVTMAERKSNTSRAGGDRHGACGRRPPHPSIEGQGEAGGAADGPWRATPRASPPPRQERALLWRGDKHALMVRTDPCTHSEGIRHGPMGASASPG